MSRVALYIVLAFALSGCAVSSPDVTTTGSLDRLVQPTSTTHQTSVAGQSARAIVSLPVEAGRIKRVVQALPANGLRQEIVYDQTLPGLPDSAIDLRVRLSSTPTLDEKTAIAQPSEAGIAAEMKTQFPRMAMKVVETPRANAYGPYGLAVGRWDNGTRCLYAWQWIDDVKTERTDGVAHPASLRIRLCRSGLTLDQMAGFVDRLHIDAIRTDEPVVAARAVSPALPPRLKQPRLRPAASRPAVVAAVPASVAARQDAPLDPSLPAAAYRGPMTAAK